MNKNNKDQLNTAREEVNSRVSKLNYLGKSKRVAWGNQRRNRSI